MLRALVVFTAFCGLTLCSSQARAAATALAKPGSAGIYQLDAQAADSPEIAAALALASGRTLTGAPVATNQRWTGTFEGSLSQLLRRFLAGQGHVLTADGRIQVASGLKGPQQAPAPAAPPVPAQAASVSPPAAAARAPVPAQTAQLTANGRVQKLLRAKVAPAKPAAPTPERGSLRIRNGVVEADPAAQAQLAATTRQAQADAQALAAALQAARGSLPQAPPAQTAAAPR